MCVCWLGGGVSGSVVMDCGLTGTSMSMEFSQQEYWSELPFPSPGNLSDPGTEPGHYKRILYLLKFFTWGTREAPPHTHTCLLQFSDTIKIQLLLRKLRDIDMPHTHPRPLLINICGASLFSGYTLGNARKIFRKIIGSSMG